jgi:hypothetical protein
MASKKKPAVNKPAAEPKPAPVVKKSKYNKDLATGKVIK